MSRICEIRGYLPPLSRSCTGISYSHLKRQSTVMQHFLVLECMINRYIQENPSNMTISTSSTWKIKYHLSRFCFIGKVTLFAKKTHSFIDNHINHAQRSYCCIPIESKTNGSQFVSNDLFFNEIHNRMYRNYQYQHFIEAKR